jgi:DNA-binding NarL/FixJ family response regulator
MDKIVKSMPKGRILIADNHTLVREGVKSLINGLKDFTVVGEVTQNSELLTSIASLQPDIIIMDYDIPGFFFIDDLRLIYENHPNAKILVVTTNRSQADVLKALEYGVNNYILKLCEKDEFISALYATAREERFFCGKVIDVIFDKQFPKIDNCKGRTLSPREIEIVQLISKGLTNNDIAEKLFISTYTVGTHRKNILRKLELNKSSELIMYAVKNGLLEQVTA